MLHTIIIISSRSLQALPHFVMLGSGDLTTPPIKWIFKRYLYIPRVLLVRLHDHASYHCFSLTNCQNIFKVQNCLLPVGRLWLRACRDGMVNLKYHTTVFDKHTKRSSKLFQGISGITPIPSHRWKKKIKYLIEH